MMKIAVILRTCSFLLTILFFSILFAIPILIGACLPKRWRFSLRFPYWCMDVIYRAVIRSLWVPVTYIGDVPRRTNHPVILAANHQSTLDIFLVSKLFHGHPHTSLVWYAYSQYPVFGFLLRRMCILVDTRSPRRAIQSITQAKELLLSTDLDLMIYPEGGRYTDGSIHDFFKGFAILARETARPVMPILLLNTAKVCEPKTVWIRWAPLTVVVGPEMTPYDGETAEQFSDRVREWFLKQNGTHSIST